MKRDLILNELRRLQPKYKKEGILLLGLFGSCANAKETPESDIDILIETTPWFVQKYKGFKAFVRLDELKNELKNELKGIFDADIDLVDKTGLKQHGNTFILDNTLYVS